MLQHIKGLHSTTFSTHGHDRESRASGKQRWDQAQDPGWGAKSSTQPSELCAAEEVHRPNMTLEKRTKVASAQLPVPAPSVSTRMHGPTKVWCRDEKRQSRGRDASQPQQHQSMDELLLQRHTAVLPHVPRELTRWLRWSVRQISRSQQLSLGQFRPRLAVILRRQYALLRTDAPRQLAAKWLSFARFVARRPVGSIGAQHIAALLYPR